MGWFDPVPVYVTRPTSRGHIGEITVGAWLVIPIVFLTAFNIIGWGIYGLVELIGKL